MNDSVRLFVAVPLPSDLMQYLLSARQAYENPAIRMVPEENLHLTLYFIGNVPTSEAPEIKHKLAQVAKWHQPLTLELQQLEPGPKATAPRLIWARFHVLEAFAKLSQDVTKMLSDGHPEHSKIIPHITLCRFKKDVLPIKPLPVITAEEEIHFPVLSIALWQSQLGSPHPMYTLLEEFRLGIAK